jgi:predicted secreted protein
VTNCYNEQCNKELPERTPVHIIRLPMGVKLTISLCEECVVKHSWRISRVNAMVRYEEDKKKKTEEEYR